MKNYKIYDLLSANPNFISPAVRTSLVESWRHASIRALILMHEVLNIRRTKDFESACAQIKDPQDLKFMYVVLKGQTRLPRHVPSCEELHELLSNSFSLSAHHLQQKPPPASFKASLPTNSSTANIAHHLHQKPPPASFKASLPTNSSNANKAEQNHAERGRMSWLPSKTALTTVFLIGIAVLVLYKKVVQASTSEPAPLVSLEENQPAATTEVTSSLTPGNSGQYSLWSGIFGSLNNLEQFFEGWVLTDRGRAEAASAYVLETVKTMKAIVENIEHTEKSEKKMQAQMRELEHTNSVSQQAKIVELIQSTNATTLRVVNDALKMTSEQFSQRDAEIQKLQNDTKTILSMMESMNHKLNTMGRRLKKERSAKNELRKVLETKIHESEKLVHDLQVNMTSLQDKLSDNVLSNTEFYDNVLKIEKKLKDIWSWPNLARIAVTVLLQQFVLFLVAINTPASFLRVFRSETKQTIAASPPSSDTPDVSDIEQYYEGDWNSRLNHPSESSVPIPQRTSPSQSMSLARSPSSRRSEFRMNASVPDLSSSVNFDQMGSRLQRIIQRQMLDKENKKNLNDYQAYLEQLLLPLQLFIIKLREGNDEDPKAQNLETNLEKPLVRLVANLSDTEANSRGMYSISVLLQYVAKIMDTIWTMQDEKDLPSNIKDLVKNLNFWVPSAIECLLGTAIINRQFVKDIRDTEGMQNRTDSLKKLILDAIDAANDNTVQGAFQINSPLSHHAIHTPPKSETKQKDVGQDIFI